jgi:hypothetical protein
MICRQRPLFRSDHKIFWSKNKGPATHFTAVIVFARVNVVVSFVPL